MTTKKLDFNISVLGEAKISCPIMMSTTHNDGQADYVNDDDHILFGIDTDIDENGHPVPRHEETVEVAGPRAKIYFNPAHVHAAICTCGGICPGLNNVIRSLVHELNHGYGVREILGFVNGYQGLDPWRGYGIRDLSHTSCGECVPPLGGIRRAKLFASSREMMNGSW